MLPREGASGRHAAGRVFVCACALVEDQPEINLIFQSGQYSDSKPQKSSKNEKSQKSGQWGSSGASVGLETGVGAGE